MHVMYDISDDDMRYVLATFVVTPIRWVQRYGWRALTDAEVLACVRYYQELGRRMAIPDIPPTYADFERLLDVYERDHFAFDPGARRVADATLELFASFYPRPLAPAVRLFSRCVMDSHLVDALGYRRPRPVVRRIATSGLRLRARVVALLPPRRRPTYFKDRRQVCTYPYGFDVARLGTFAPACPRSREAAGRNT
jgi:hypothetical protein